MLDKTNLYSSFTKEDKTDESSVVIPFTKNFSLKGINPDWADKHYGYGKISEVPILFVPVVTSYNADPDNSNYFSLSLDLSSTPEVRITKSVNKSGVEVTEKGTKRRVKSSKV